MPVSLWLVPHEGNPFTKAVKELISEDVPRNFLSPNEYNLFTPHVTVIPEVDVGKSPQEWLDNLQIPDFKAEKNEVILELDTVEAGDDFYRKMNISVKENDNLTELASACKQASSSEAKDKAQSWAKNDFQPCFPLLLADVPTQDVKMKVPLIEMKIGFAIGDIFACCGGTLCMGGHLVLVDTTQPIDQWKPVAKRETPWAMWRATRNLI